MNEQIKVIDLEDRSNLIIGEQYTLKLRDCEADAILTKYEGDFLEFIRPTSRGLGIDIVNKNHLEIVNSRRGIGQRYIKPNKSFESQEIDKKTNPILYSKLIKKLDGFIK